MPTGLSDLLAPGASLRLLPVALCLLTMVFDVVVVQYAWRRRHMTPAALGLVAAELGASGWNLTNGVLELARIGVVDAAGVAAAVRVGGIFQSTAVVGYVLMVRWLVDPLWRPSRGQLASTSLYVVLAVAVVASDPYLHLFVVQAGLQPGRASLWVPGPAFFVLLGLADVWLGALAVQTVRRLRGAPVILRRQFAFVALGGGVCAVAFTVETLARPVDSPVPVTTTALLVSALTYLRALFSRGLLSVVPVARTLVLDSLDDAVIVVDALGRVVDVNRAAVHLLRRVDPGRADPVGTLADDLLPCLGLPTPVAPGRHEALAAEGALVLDVRVAGMTDRFGSALATVLTVRDVSELHRQMRTIEQLRDELAELAVRDELTGLYNRRRLGAVLEEELAVARRTGRDLAVLMVDVDHFKSVNDTYGHAVGDAVLAGVARALGGAVHEWDLVARYGGEEFVVLLTDCTPEQALVRADALRLLCAGLQVPTAAGPVSRTVSIGVAMQSQWPRYGADALLKTADSALYGAKETGRDRVELARPRQGSAAVR